MYIKRNIELEISKSIANNPVVAILGPRQCGKSTLAKKIGESHEKGFVYLDLEKPSDLSKLDNAEWFLNSQKNKLICLDEIQRKPEVFPLLRSLVDEWGGNGHFLLLGSASRDLLKQSSESLAGRISYKQLSQFISDELEGISTTEDLLSRGGFPRSIFATDDETSFEWRENFISTFLERDLMLWSGFSPSTMRKLWQMIAYLNGQIINYSNLGSSLGVSHTTVRNYTELLASTFMLKILPPFQSGNGKRLVKSPKIYMGDVGIANALLRLDSFEQLAGHPSFGTAWENLVLMNIKGAFPKFNFYFYRTSHGAEIDFIIETKQGIIAAECKASMSPKLSRGAYTAIDDLKPSFCYIVSPIEKRWQMSNNIEVVNILDLISELKKYQ